MISRNGDFGLGGWGDLVDVTAGATAAGSFAVNCSG